MRHGTSKINTPVITIGIPTYNRPDGLRRTLIEITKQTYKNIDIIVSDNNPSANEAENIVHEFMQNDQRISYYRQSHNVGLYPNFQFLLERSKGEYFMWCADDDWHEPNFIEALLKAIAADESSVAAFCDFNVKDERGFLISGYPEPCTALRLMAGRNAVIRQVRFFMLAEGSAIPHVMYGLLPMRYIKEFSWIEHVRLYGEYAADTLFIFWLLGQGRLTFDERKLFGCTVNNKKFYGSIRKCSLIERLHMVYQRINYLMSFIKIANGWTKLVLLCVFPLKLTETLFSTMLGEPFKSVLLKLKR